MRTAVVPAPEAARDNCRDFCRLSLDTRVTVDYGAAARGSAVAERARGRRRPREPGRGSRTGSRGPPAPRPRGSGAFCVGSWELSGDIVAVMQTYAHIHAVDCHIDAVGLYTYSCSPVGSRSMGRTALFSRISLTL